MRPSERDAGLLRDMLSACREADQFAAGIELEAFRADRKLCLAVERCLEIVGEAAGKITAEFQQAHPHVPWRQIKGMRNILAHEYGGIDYEIIHNTATMQMPELLAVLQKMLEQTAGKL
jgi:uncharacterized protein with HEPN domain